MWRLLNAFFALILVFAAAVQYNDPDATRWIVMYLSAAGVSVAAAIRRLPWAVPAALALTALAWALTLIPDVLERGGVGGFFGSWGMANIAVEEGRELYGLLIVFGWMTVVAFHEWRNRHGAQSVRWPPS